jgi:hypothetical protein
VTGVRVPSGVRLACLLRESYREGARVRKRTLANLSSLSDAQIAAIRVVLRGEPVSSSPLTKPDPGVLS